MSIKYDFSNTWEAYSKLLRKYKLDELLKKINLLSNEIMATSGNDHIRGVLEKTFPLVNYITRERYKQPVIISGWGLIDLAYHAIMATNDYRGKLIESDNELYALCSADDNYNQKNEETLIDDMALDNTFMFYLWGFVGEQFKMQRAGKIFSNAGRELYMLFEIAPRCGVEDIAAIVIRETGVTWKVLCSSLYLLWLKFHLYPNVNNFESSINWDDEFKLSEYSCIAERYTATYDDVRSSNLKRQALYTRPYIKTQTGEMVAVNSYLNLFLYEHCVLWAVRDYYKRQGDQIFTAMFGGLFEEYFSELLHTYCQEASFYRIPEEEEPRADWFAEICGYKFLIEQKSTIIQLAAKQQQSNHKVVIDFSKRTVIKAMKQLRATELALGDGPYIKIILLYEDYISSNIIDAIFSLPNCDIENDGYYWVVSIEEMERFIALSKNDPAKCAAIIEKKLRLDAEHSTEGTSLEFLLHEDEVLENEYLQQEKISNYTDFAKNFCIGKLIHKD